MAIETKVGISQKLGQYSTKFGGKVAKQGGLFYQGMGEGFEKSVPDFIEAKQSFNNGNDAFKRGWAQLTK